MVSLFLILKEYDPRGRRSFNLLTTTGISPSEKLNNRQRATEIQINCNELSLMAYILSTLRDTEAQSLSIVQEDSTLVRRPLIKYSTQTQ